MRKFILISAVLFFGAVSGLEARRPAAKHVVIIGVDGWASYCLRQAENIPNTRMLMENGEWTLRKRSVMPSSSAINWASFFMGVPTEMHGYNKWNSSKPEIEAYQVTEGGIPPTIYTLLREQRPAASSAAVYNWDGIANLIDTASVTYCHYDPGYHLVDKDYSVESYTRMHAVPIIKNMKPALFTFYIGDLDEAGHKKGWDSPAYYECMSECDKAIGIIIDALKEAGIYDDTIIIVTSDHGGVRKGHGGFSLKEMETPFILCGRNIRKGVEFEGMIMQYDATSVIANLLGLKVPAQWRGKTIKELRSAK